MKNKSFLIIISFFLFFPFVNGEVNPENLEIEVIQCRSQVTLLEIDIKDLEEKISEKDAWIRKHIAITRAQGSSLNYVQNVRLKGNEIIESLEKEIKIIKNQKEKILTICDKKAVELNEYRNKSYIQREVKNGINPCHQNYYPYKGKCVHEKEICIDVTNGYFDWKEGSCRCREGYIWRLNKCRPLDGDYSSESFQSSFAENSHTLSSSNLFQSLDNFKVRLSQIGKTEKYHLQFFYSNREVRDGIQKYNLRIESNGGVLRDRYLRRGNIVYPFKKNEIYLISIEAIDQNNEILDLINFNIQIAEQNPSR